MSNILRKILKGSMVFALALVLSSCSVWENRTKCPAWLLLDTKNVIHVVDSINVSLYKDNGTNIVSTKMTTSKGSKPYIKKFIIPKGEIFLNTYYTDQKINDNKYIIPVGKECGNVMARIDTIVNYKDTVYRAVRLYRRYAKLNILVQHIKSFNDLTFSLTSSTVGYNLKDFSPIKGKFKVDKTVKDLNGKGLLSYNIPAQGFDDLVLTIYSHGEIVDSFNISDILKKENYDWSNNHDLKDIFLDLTIKSQDIRVIIGDWDNINNINVNLK